MDLSTEVSVKKTIFLKPLDAWSIIKPKIVGVCFHKRWYLNDISSFTGQVDREIEAHGHVQGPSIENIHICLKGSHALWRPLSSLFEEVSG